jgi:hypothetical protein
MTNYLPWLGARRVRLLEGQKWQSAGYYLPPNMPPVVGKRLVFVGAYVP